MDSLKKGYAFFKLAWQAARGRRMLLVPSLYSMLAGLILTAVMVALISLAVYRLGPGALGPLLAGLLIGLLVFGLFAISSIFSAMTACLFYQELTGAEANLAAAWNSLRLVAGEVFLLSTASIGIAIGRWWAQRSPISPPPEKAWREALYLVIPAMAIECIPLQAGLQRVAGIVRGHLLRIGEGVVGVSAFSRLAGLGFGAAGALLGLGLSLLLSRIGHPAGFKLAGILIGLLIAVLFILVAIAAGAYATTAYHTCLYHWARQSEHARQGGQQAAEGVAAPSLLAVILSGTA